MDYSRIMSFRGQWRTYQARVLKNADRYIRDGRIHIVAAPGSGKTTLGIELIGRMGEPALVLAPSITIREQWVARIVEGFLQEGVNDADYISQSLKEPRAITVVTYQALHSAMTRYKGKVDAEENAADGGTDDTCGQTEEVDYTDFDVVSVLKECRIGTLCLDECHHLRAEWWKALEEFKSAMGEVKVIALTATPPYDSTPAFWKRYMDMCGEIDEEITIPELVKEGSLCPHQDYVYFNYPTQDEAAEVEAFKMRSRQMYEKLLWDDAFCTAVVTHGSLHGNDEAWDALLADREYLLAFVCFLQARNVAMPDDLRQMAGKRIGTMQPKYMERLLQGFLYEDSGYVCEEYRKQLEAELKTQGLIEKKKVSFTLSESIAKLLTASKGKCKSICDIAAHEYRSLGAELRMLVLTDYIRKEYEKCLGDLGSEVTALGVLPFFEQLRRKMPKELRLGVLCGTIVIIPAEAKAALEAAVGENKISFSAAGNLSEDQYLKVTAVGDSHFLTGAVTEIFRQGCIQVLIGTKSLLGEGWDSPCINSLILASVVGSFMLSNQMRGRAIRVFKENPEKTSNIWHLVCLPPETEQRVDAVSKGDVRTSSGPLDGIALSEDYALLARRMEHYLGLHYTQDRIESGIGRLSIICPPFDQAHVGQMNEQTLQLSGQRGTLKERWMRALAVSRSIEIVDETEVAAESVPRTVYAKASGKVAGAVAAAVVFGVLGVVSMASPLGGLFGVLAGVSGVSALVRLPKFLGSNSSEKQLRMLGNGVCKALHAQGFLEEASGKAKTETEGGTLVTYLEGGSSRDKELFSHCMQEMFAPVTSQRYVLKKIKGKDQSYYGVPEVFGKRKEDAQMFCECVRPVIGEYELIYTRSEGGRKALMDAWVKTASNADFAHMSRKRVK